MAKTPKPSTEETKVSTATTATVYSKDGGLIRTYSLADHGDEFEKLAQEFQSHTAGSTIEVR